MVVSPLVLNGVLPHILKEHCYWVQEYPITVGENRLNLAELAKLRFLDGLNRQILAKHFGVSLNVISCAINRMKSSGFEIVGLSQDEREKILWASQN